MEKPLPYKQMTAGSVPAGPTILSYFIIWWFAVISPSGEISFFEYVKQISCDIVQQQYARVGLKTTLCQWKDEK